MAVCDKCGKEDKNVKCYEGYGVGVRLCAGTCDTEYLTKVKQITKENTSKVAIVEDGMETYPFTGDRKAIKAELVNFKNTKVRKI